MPGIRDPDGVRIVAILALQAEDDLVSTGQIVDPQFREFQKPPTVNVGFSPFFSSEIDSLRMNQSRDTKKCERITSDGETCSS